jgi:hypothetical protein
MKCLGPALLAALLNLQLLRFGGAVHVHRKQPSAGIVGKLRSALNTRTEELTQQKNIAHGLELEVRELQSELQAEKKAVAAEAEKEHTLQRKLGAVRAALDDGVTPSTITKKTQAPAGSADASSAPTVPVAMPVVPVAIPASVAMPQPTGEALAVDKADAAVKPVQLASSGTPLPPMQPSQDADMPDADQESPEELAAQTALFGSALPKPAAATHQQAAQTLPAIEEPSAPVAKPSAAVHKQQTTPQEPPPFFEAAAIQSAAVKKTVPAEAQAKVVKNMQKGVLKAAQQAPKKLDAQPQKAVAVPAAPVAPSAPAANAATTAKDSAALSEPASDFDALEAQLHEEDRRIQDLDKENALDAVSDGGLPPAPGSVPALPPAPGATVPAADKAPLKGLPAQPKLELDAEAPMEDFLNVEAPGTDSAAAPEASPVAAPPDPVALALPQVGEGLDGALSDNQFLAQIAPGPRRA